MVSFDETFWKSHANSVVVVVVVVPGVLLRTPKFRTVIINESPPFTVNLSKLIF